MQKPSNLLHNQQLVEFMRVHFALEMSLHAVSEHNGYYTIHNELYIRDSCFAIVHLLFDGAHVQIPANRVPEKHAA